MRILLTVDPEIPVPPPQYGGIERIVSSLCQEYTRAGHEVWLFAHPDSGEAAVTKLLGWKRLKSGGLLNIAVNALQLARAVRSIKPDVIHSFSRLLYLYPVLGISRARIVQSYQRKVSPQSTRLMRMVAGKQIFFTACGAHMFATLPATHRWQAIHNFTDTRFFVPIAEPSLDYLFFLGRIEPVKGTREAIQAARSAGKKLIIAGNIPREHQDYFDKEVRPYIDNERLIYVGPVNDEQKRKLLQHAQALLFPISWEEPFGIVMSEALACGTPVLAFRRGAVSEVIQEGVNGFIVSHVAELSAAILRLPELDRARVRESAADRFSAQYIAGEYLSLFERLAPNRQPFGGAKTTATT